jgi:1-aminocyclopropane-1-carboxylate deaminase/D-cysteine desulfhydrase-like pyridoxal-dependent ACC family enzyme
MPEELALFRAFPVLGQRLPVARCTRLPTRVQRLERLARAYEVADLWIKRDDESGALYGGNKPRKLDFLLGEAMARRARSVITFGGIGTNHGLATTVHASRLGIRTALILVKQPLTGHVQENLLLDRHFEAEIHYSSNTAVSVLKTAGVYLRRARVYFIPPGGSSTLGSLGYVNAALELKKQVEAGLLPEPEHIFCALGSKGTQAGLMLGARLAGMKTRVTGVRVAEKWITKNENIVRLANRMVALLHKYDKSVPPLKFTLDDVHVNPDFFGGLHGRVTEQGMHAEELMQKTEGIQLEQVYTAKTVATLLDFIAGNPGLKGAPVLYWHTYNGADMSRVLQANHDYTTLPKDLHWCFDEKLAPCLKDE